MFQSTHSLRSATFRGYRGKLDAKVSIHALLAECDLPVINFFSVAGGFNPRTPCGVRRQIPAYRSEGVRFQSTHSLRSATFSIVFYKLQDKVSIHALLAECDRPISHTIFIAGRFNPRTPCGVRLFIRPPLHLVTKFQSTHSLRSATPRKLSFSECKAVSIHALLAECDLPFLVVATSYTGFNPRTPCGVRPICRIGLPGFSPFQSTHSLRSATFRSCMLSSTT